MRNSPLPYLLIVLHGISQGISFAKEIKESVSPKLKWLDTPNDSDDIKSVNNNQDGLRSYVVKSNEEKYLLKKGKTAVHEFLFKDKGGLHRATKTWSSKLKMTRMSVPKYQRTIRAKDTLRNMIKEQTRVRREEPSDNTTNDSKIVNLTSKSTVASKTDKPINYDTKSILTWTRHYTTNQRTFKKRKPQSLSLTGATIGGIILLLVGGIVVYFIWRLKNKERSYDEASQRMESNKREETDVGEGILTSNLNQDDENVT